MMGPSCANKWLAIWAVLLVACQQTGAMEPLEHDALQLSNAWFLDSGDARLANRLVRRQVTIPGVQNEQPKSGVFSLFQSAEPQVDRFKALQTLFSPTSSNGQSQQASAFQPAQLMAQLTELIKATQDRQAKALETTERAAQGAQEQGVQAAKQAQGGIQSALTEIGQGLMKLGANNPNLLPDIKNLYQSISSKLSSASSSVAQAAAPPKSGIEQFAEQVAKAGQSGAR